jgi:superfamily II DNA or RNA helicase
MGFLTDYRIFAPPSDIDLSSVTTSAGGDYSPEPLRKAVHKSHIVGDVVQHYIKIANGKLGVTFAVDVASATEIAAAYRAAGVKAEVVSAQTPDMVRMGVLRRFANREVMQLVNVDLFGEGFDLPAIEVISMARPTQSFSLYAQQFGRALRLLAGKAHGIIIDHVGNVARHGLPDAHREWTLDRREKRSRSTVSDVMPIRVCPQCTGAYEADQGLTCPYCGHHAEPAGRSLPEQVDGDLYELTPEALARLRGEIDKPPSEHSNTLIQASLNARHREAAEAQRELRAAMSEWAAGMDDLPRAWRRFYLTFGLDVLSAQALGRADAEVLTKRIKSCST